MKATAIAPANIAFIKYWGKVDEKLRLPANDSISMNLSSATTTTTVEFSSQRSADHFELADSDTTCSQPRQRQHVGLNVLEKERIAAHIDRIRQRAGISLRAKVLTKNSFPKGVGIASSASGFAALTVAGCAAAGLTLSEKELTTLARLGSGSACRSIPDGFVRWYKGSSHETSYARSVFASHHWDLRDIVAVVSDEEKRVSSTTGMERAVTSPFWKTRLSTTTERIDHVMKALRYKDIRLLGQAIEEECLSMHAVMMTQKPPMLYLTSNTLSIIQSVLAWRSGGLPVYFTIDAGPNVHIICEGANEHTVLKRIQSLRGVRSVISNSPARGVQITHKHLF